MLFNDNSYQVKHRIGAGEYELITEIYNNQDELLVLHI